MVEYSVPWTDSSKELLMVQQMDILKVGKKVALTAALMVAKMVE